MIDKNSVSYGEPNYFVPTYSSPAKVSILKIHDDIAIVKQYSRKKEYRPYQIPLEFVCGSRENAKKCGRKWEHWKRSLSKG